MHSDLPARKIVEEPLEIAGDICIYTNAQVKVETIEYPSGILFASPMPLPPPTLPPTPTRSLFFPALLLATFLILAKAFCMGAARAARYPLRLATITAADALFAALVGLLGWSILATFSPWPRLVRFTRRLIIALCAACVFFSIVSVNAFAYLGTWLDSALLQAGAEVKQMRSSLTPFLTFKTIAALIGFPLLYLNLVWLAGQRRRMGPSRSPRLRTVLLTALAILLWFIGARLLVIRSRSIDLARLAQNPHVVLIKSLLPDRFVGSRSDPGDEFSIDRSNDLTADFKIVSQRPRPEIPTPNLARGPKNILVVICESVGTQFLSLYGSPYRTWPRMEAESRHALVFDNYYAHFCNSSNSMYTMMLSSYPALSAQEYTRGHPDAPGTTAAQVLKRLGYRTAFIAAGFNEWANWDKFLPGRGFDRVTDASTSGYPAFNSWGIEDRHLVDQILKYVDEDKSKPFYLFTWTICTHHPYGPEYGAPAKDWDNPVFLKAEDERKFGGMSWDLGRYLCAMYELDKQLGRLLDGLRQRGIADDTLVIITGDHGEAFGWPHKTYGHGGGVYQDYLSVPMMIWNPRLFPATLSSTRPRAGTLGGHIDLQATILDLLGLPPQPTWQGRSLFAQDRPPRVYLFGSADQGYLGVREKNLKYIYNRLIGTQSLYDLSADPLEQSNLADARPEECKQLRQRLAAWAQYQRELSR